jgi:hypothetical protein
MIIILIVLLVLLFGGGYGYYGRRRWGLGWGGDIGGLILFILLLWLIFRFV